MAKTFTAPFAQTQKTLTAVLTAASVITTDAATNTVLCATAGADGALVTKVSLIPRATITATAAYLFVSKDSGTTLRLIDSCLMPAYTMAATTATPVTLFSMSQDAPLRLEASDKLYVSIGVALASGVVAKCEWTDY